MSDTPLSSGNHGKLFHLFDEEKTLPRLNETKVTKLADGLFQSAQPVLFLGLRKWIKSSFCRYSMGEFKDRFCALKPETCHVRV